MASLLGGWLGGDHSEVDAEALNGKWHLDPKILCDDEVIEMAFKTVRDMFVLTNKRILLVDVQGVTGSKTEYKCVPYRSIVHFSLVTAGAWDTDAELMLCTAAGELKQEIRKGQDVMKLQRILTQHCCP